MFDAKGDAPQNPRGHYLIWTYMRCFDHDKPDFGIDEYLEKVGRTPDDFCALVVHPDFVHQHPGMEREVTLPPHLCGCRKDPRRLSAEVYRKYSWTNYQLRGLIDALHERGIALYLSLMGLYYNDIYHDEWMGQHKEVLFQASSRVEELNALKHLSDGTLYEDFFLQKLTETLLDYGFDGIHLCDRFSPLSEPLADGDFSADMLQQFSAHTGIAIPQELAGHLDEDSTEQKKARQAWLWTEHRAAWIRFYDWRWTKFYEKVCAGVHAVHGKVSTLGMYVSDPLRSMYSMGIDIAHLSEAGVDFFTPNILPTSCNMNNAKRPPLFHRYMCCIPAVSAMARSSELYFMCGVRDEEEEWDVLHHAPNQFERDVHTALGYQLIAKDGVRRCVEKPFITLGDSIGKNDWQLLNGYLDPIYASKTESIVSPVLCWSDRANTHMLDAHIRTRRPSITRLQALLQENGAFCGGVVRTEDLEYCKSPLLIPAFDLLSTEEQDAVLGCGMPVLGIAPADFDLSGLPVTFSFTDRFSKYPHTAFLLRLPKPEDAEKYVCLLSEDDGSPELPDETLLHDARLNVMDEMFVQKVSSGFAKAAAELFVYMDHFSNPFASNAGLMVFREDRQTYRVSVYNAYDCSYQHALVHCKVPMAHVETLSSFPYQPVQFVDEITFAAETRDMAKRLDEATGCTFQLKIRPAGVSVFRITVKST